MKKEYFTLKIPGKTFISGEYLALFGGNSLIVSTKPGFQVFFVKKTTANSHFKNQSEIIKSLCKVHKLNEKYFDSLFLKNNQSPAEIFYQKNINILEAWEIYFYDAYDKKGGFGASTAQFLALYLFNLLIKNNFNSFNLKSQNNTTSDNSVMKKLSNIDTMLSSLDLRDLLFQYWNCQNNAATINLEIESELNLEPKLEPNLEPNLELNHGLRHDRKSELKPDKESILEKLFLLPSGNDLLAQNFPGFNFIEKDLRIEKFSEIKIELNNTIDNPGGNANAQKKIEWPFADLDFFLAWTGNKTPTHQHLKDLKSFQSANLSQIQQRIKESFLNSNQADFITNINLWHEELNNLNLVCEPTLKLIEQSKKVPAIKAIKGCGALGSDVLFVLYSKTDSDTDSVKKWLHLNSIQITYSLEDVWQESVNIERHLWD